MNGLEHCFKEAQALRERIEELNRIAQPFLEIDGNAIGGATKGNPAGEPVCLAVSVIESLAEVIYQANRDVDSIISRLRV